jgi:crotonobetainyl-CoA:carnitine CoA-transferase CaiB-like acyl-CoA transferase
MRAKVGRVQAVASPIRPFDGLRVIELGSSIAGSYCTQFLASFGADVIKVEPPEGAVLRRVGPTVRDLTGPEVGLVHLYLDRGKRAITLDPASTTGRYLLSGLVADADVIVDGLGAGRLTELGLPYPQLAQFSPRTVLTSISAFGEDSPYWDYLDSELVVMAFGGLLNLIGEIGRPPIRLGGQQSQYQTGLAAFAGIVTALHARDRDDRGEHVEVVAQEVVAFTEWKSAIYYQASGRARRRGGHESQWLIVRCADGFIAFVHRNEWPRIIEMVGDARLAEERFSTIPLRIAHRDEMRQIIEAWALGRAKSAIYHDAQARGIPVGMVADMADVFESPQYRAEHFFEVIDHPVAGELSYVGIPWRMNGMRPRSSRAPLLGEHNASVYGELGIPPAELAMLRERAVI